MVSSVPGEGRPFTKVFICKLSVRVWVLCFSLHNRIEHSRNGREKQNNSYFVLLLHPIHPGSAHSFPLVLPVCHLLFSHCLMRVCLYTVIQAIWLTGCQHFKGLQKPVFNINLCSTYLYSRSHYEKERISWSSETERSHSPAKDLNTVRLLELGAGATAGHDLASVGSVPGEGQVLP